MCQVKINAMKKNDADIINSDNDTDVTSVETGTVVCGMMGESSLIRCYFKQRELKTVTMRESCGYLRDECCRQRKQQAQRH